MDVLKVKKLSTNASISLEVLSPVHVGTASEKLWLRNLDFFYRDEWIYILDKPKLILELSNLETSRGTSALVAYQQIIASGKVWEIGDFLEDCGLDLEAVVQEKYLLKNEPANEIRPLIRTGQGMSIIPGSSLKGAIRSVLFHHLYGKHRPQDERNSDRELFGSIDNNIMSFIRVFDANCERTAIINIELFNLYEEHGDWESDYKNEFIVSAEAFPVGATASFRISVADGLLEVLQRVENRLKAKNQLKKHLTPRYVNEVVKKGQAISFLFGLINQYTRTHIDREIEFFSKFDQAEDVQFIIQNLESFREETQKEGQCVLRLAFGSGFHGITGDYRFKDHTKTIYQPDQKNLTWDMSTRSRRPARYKSRKITGFDVDASLMGFVKLSL